MREDTIKLLRECNQGIKMGISALDDVMEHVKDTQLKEVLMRSRKEHSRLGDETHKYLNEYQDDDKEPPMMAKVMSWVKTNMKFSGEDSDRTVADLITDGCNMGLKSLHKYLHEYDKAEDKVRKLVAKVILEEEELTKAMRAYL